MATGCSSGSRRMRHVFGVAILAALCACRSVPDEQTAIAKAKRYQAEGHYRSAIIELKNLLQADGNHAQARLLLGQLHMDLGDVQAAQKELRRAEALGAASAAVQPALAESYVIVKQYDKALAVIEQPPFDPAQLSPRVQRLRADSYLGLGKTEKAQEIYRALLAQNENSNEARRGLARVALHVGDDGKALVLVKQAIGFDSKDKASWLLRGQIDSKRQDYAAAEQAYTHALDTRKLEAITHEELWARVGLIEALLAQNKIAPAAQRLKELRRFLSAHPAARYLRARIAMAEGDHDIAETELRAVLKTFPDHGPSLLMLGAVKYAQEQLEQADMFLSGFLAAQPGHSAAHKLLAATRLRLAQPAGAKAALTPLSKSGARDAEWLSLMGIASFQAGEYAQASSFLEQGVKASPDNTALRVNLALGYIAENRFRAAIDLLEKNAPAASVDGRRDTLLLWCYLRERETAKADALATKLIDSAGADDRVYERLGTLFAAAGYSEKASAFFLELVARKPLHAAALYSLGRIAHSNGRTTAADAYYRRALQADPKHAQAMGAMTQLALAEGREQQAITWLERARAGNKAADTPRLLLAQLYTKRGDTQRALAVAAEAIALQPKRAEGYLVLSRAHQAAGNYKEARQSLQTAVTHAPNDAALRYDLGHMHWLAAELREAKTAFAEALRLQPDWLPAIGALAMVTLRLGDTDAAYTLAKNLQNHPERKEIGFALEGDLDFMSAKYADAAGNYAQAAAIRPAGTLAVKTYQARYRAGLPQPEAPLTQWLAGHPEDAEIRLALAQAYVTASKTQAAVREFERIVSADAEHATSLNNLAWLYWQQGDTRALDMAERAYRVSPGNGAVTDTLGWLLVQTGAVQRGLALLRKADAEAPHSPEIRYHLAYALVKSGARSEAQSLLAGLIASNAAFASREQARALMQTIN